jgi:hypothetical protein
MITVDILPSVMRRTAQALAMRRVDVEFDGNTDERYRTTTTLYKSLQPAGHVRGFCAWHTDDTCLIVIDPGASLGSLYQVFLHETAHAYLYGISLPDVEEAVWELASYWAVWIARRNPRDHYELLQWLGKLEGYHAANRRDFIFQKGANRGRILPSAATVQGLRRSVYEL